MDLMIIPLSLLFLLMPGHSLAQHRG